MKSLSFHLFRTCCCLILISAVISIPGRVLVAQEQSGRLSQEQTEFFEKKIRPLLAEHCYKCHATDSEKIKGGLLLDSREATLRGGDSGHAVVPGDLYESLLYVAVTYKDSDLEMPPVHI